MFSPNAAVTKAKFSATYYKDPRFQVNHSVTFLDNAEINQPLFEPNLYHRLPKIFRLTAQ